MDRQSSLPFRRTRSREDKARIGQANHTRRHLPYRTRSPDRRRARYHAQGRGCARRGLAGLRRPRGARFSGSFRPLRSARVRDCGRRSHRGGGRIDRSGAARTTARSAHRGAMNAERHTNANRGTPAGVPRFALQPQIKRLQVSAPPPCSHFPPRDPFGLARGRTRRPHLQRAS